MRWRVKASCAALLALALAGCAEVETTGLARPNLIIVREFAASEGVVALDPSFGFSLYRGAAGVPPRQRAASVGRAATFNLADTVVEQLRRLGYDAVRADAASPQPGGRALVVTGAFRQINEGHRRHVGAEDASVAVAGEIDYQSAGAPPPRAQAVPPLFPHGVRRAGRSAPGPRGFHPRSPAGRGRATQWPA